MSDRRDFDEAELELIRQGRMPDAKTQWHRRKAMTQAPEFPAAPLDPERYRKD